MTTANDTTFAPATDQQASEWITVLSAAGLDYTLAHEDGRWIIHVPAAMAETARAEIEAYEEDVRTWPCLEPPSPSSTGIVPQALAPPWVTGMVLAAYALLGPYDGHAPLLRAGAVDSEAVLNGEWWRIVTGLTLHSDVTHLAGNLFCLLLLEYGLGRTFGTGLTWCLLLTSGAAGNLAASFLHGTGHLSVGASTACFGGLGIVSACQAIRNLRRYGTGGGIWNRTWIPVGAGLALLTLLGTGPRSDLAAHLLGFTCGLILAIPAAVVEAKKLPAWIQRLLQLGCITVLAAAWIAARSAGSGN